MPTWLLELLGLAPEATEDEAKAALAALMEKAKASSETSDAPAEMANEMAQNKAELEKVKADLEKVNTQLANERKEKREALVADALQAGRILAADKDDWTRRLENDFENESKALANAKPLFKDTRHTDRVRPGAQHSNRVAEIGAAVRKYQAETGCKDYDRAFANVKADPANAALFN